MDSNFRYRGRRPASGRSLRAQRVETDAAKREFGSGSCLFAPPWGRRGGLGGGLCLEIPTPGNGREESRPAPIGRHFRLLRRGVLRTGCFPRQAAFQGGHVIDDRWRGRDLPGFNGEPLHSPKWQPAAVACGFTPRSVRGVAAGAEPEVRIHLPPAVSQLRTGLSSTMVARTLARL